MSEKKDVKGTVFSNLLWRFAERCGAQAVTLIVSIVLARLLEPQVYGVVAIVTVFTSILLVFVDSGLGNALIQKKDADDLDFSTVFYTNIVFCIALYIVIYLAAPLIALFYDNPELISLTRVLSLVVVVSGLKNVQQAYVSKHMLFRKFFYSTIGGTIGAAVVGVGMALAGFGVWALVAQQLFNVIVNTIILWFTVKWRPIWAFSWKRLKGLYAFAWKLLISNLMENLYQNIRQLIVGKVYTTEDLAYYNRGMQFPQLIIININAAIDSVLLPTMAKEQDDRQRVKNMMRRSMKTSMYIIAPVMLGLVAVAPAFIELLLTEKWIPCVPYLQIFCVALMFLPMSTANLNAINAIGRSDIYLKLEILKKAIGMILLLLTMNISALALAYSYLATTIINQFVNAFPNRKLLDYRFREQLGDVVPSLLMATVMAICIYPIGFLHLPSFVILVIQIVVGVTIYVAESVVFKSDAFTYIWNFVKTLKKSKRCHKGAKNRW